MSYFLDYRKYKRIAWYMWIIQLVHWFSLGLFRPLIYFDKKLMEKK